jgi:hypothetical protein
LCYKYKAAWCDASQWTRVITITITIAILLLPICIESTSGRWGASRVMISSEKYWGGPSYSKDNNKVERWWVQESIHIVDEGVKSDLTRLWRRKIFGLFPSHVSSQDLFLSVLDWTENERGEVCCVLHHLSSWCGACGVCGFYTLGSGFVPRAIAYFTVNLIVSILLCSILPYNLITI